jgi:beta-phosphoglucomutase-like phosphatase (HAD superfamily)/dTDP-glucose pyrophosphorylase
MNIIIPLGGKGERFVKQCFSTPKPLIPIFDKCMIEYVIDNLILSQNDKIFIIYNFKLESYDFSSIINKKYNNIRLIKIGDTIGPVETLKLGLEYIFDNFQYNSKSLILDCDTFYTEDIINIFKNANTNMVFYTNNIDLNAIYSYIVLDDSSHITDIKEKNKISDNANTGAYGFTDIKILYDFCNFVLQNNNIINQNKEPYTSSVISEMLKTNIPFIGYKLSDSNVISLGTPISVQKYKDKTYAFLFDLDGTLVFTDNIYYEVWTIILQKYNKKLDKQIYNQVIQGNNDNYVLNSLLFDSDISLNELSDMKDSLFIENINKLEINGGVNIFLNYIKDFGHKLCIVTNSNKRVANKIIKLLNIESIIDFVITNDDCINGKPNSEPYTKAIQKYNINNNKCIIFEDSKTGILSALGVNPLLLVGIETIYNNRELINYGADLSIKNFTNLNIDNLISLNTENIDFTDNIKSNILNNISITDIKDIKIDKNKLKGGFIADIIAFSISINNCRNNQSLIIKLENQNTKNNLSIMATQLRLHERELYFYINISKLIKNIKIPICYNLLNPNINFNNKNGIILENLFEKSYKINLNLNSESIDITLKIVSMMANLHSQFWNKTIFLNQKCPEIKCSNDKVFKPFFVNFINEKYALFKEKWFNNLNDNQQRICNKIFYNFDKIQTNFSIGNNLTFIHGDIKSPNIFYDVKNDNEPYFIDWQHCAIGKGTQDLIFFIIESFDILNIENVYKLLSQYYYKKITEFGIINYSFETYKNDIYDSACYIPFFTAIWFGTISNDELIEKDFRYNFITKLFYFIEFLNTK